MDMQVDQALDSTPKHTPNTLPATAQPMSGISESTTGPSTGSSSTGKSMSKSSMTRLCDTTSEHYYIYLSVEMESQDATRKGASHIELSILTFRAMLTNAIQDLFGSAMGGGINIDILAFWTDPTKDPYNRLATTSLPQSSISSNIPSDPTTALPTSHLKPTFSPTTTATAVLRCHSLDLNQLWNSLTLFNTLVNDLEARFEIKQVSSTLLGLQANSRQLQWV
ncbi:hypothetical protein BGZ94_001116 [Podila epigama]|nr:hypothetical protein BGZ94_001116 [Podila epigama]